MYNSFSLVSNLPKTSKTMTTVLLLSQASSISTESTELTWNTQCQMDVTSTGHYRFLVRSVFFKVIKWGSGIIANYISVLKSKFNNLCFSGFSWANCTFSTVNFRLRKTRTMQWGLEYQTFKYRIHSKTERFIVRISNGQNHLKTKHSEH